MWNKLAARRFTTFRFPRKDKDWEVGETVQVFFKNRSPDRYELGIAKIVRKESVRIDGRDRTLSEAEAKADGFESRREMTDFIREAHKIKGMKDIGYMNKLTLEWNTPVFLKGESE